MTEPDTYLLDRNTNVAYVCYESDADIVEGISRVFPLFFFLVAALVCITTMSKMVDEERTQIGVMKALGYGSGAITAKYLAYSGSASLLGCVLGVSAGSVIFPSAIWQGYSIMYNFASRIQLTFQWPLCAVIVCSYTGCMLAVTWFCCRRELAEVPAELIRPKAPRPASGCFWSACPLEALELPAEGVHPECFPVPEAAGDDASGCGGLRCTGGHRLWNPGLHRRYGGLPVPRGDAL